MKITVCVHGRWHAFELANGLFRHGLLNRLLTTYPAVVARRDLDTGVKLTTAPWLEVRRRAYDRFTVGAKPDFAIARAFAKLAARKATGGADILVGWSSATLEAIAPAKAAGMKVVIERGSSHISHQTEVLEKAHAEFGIPFTGTEPRMIERELAEYTAADRIAVPSRFAAETFIARGIAPEKLMINPYGVDLSRFSPAFQQESLPRILFVGSVGFRKGVPALLGAFKGLEKVAELHLVGPVEKEFEGVLASLISQNVFIRGAMPGRELADEFRRSHIFCLPSLEEGFGMVVLEAMASGLPVVISDVAGAADIVTDGQQGRIIDIRNRQSLHQALAELVADPDLRHAMGEASRARVATGYSWEDYVKRAIPAYEGLIGKHPRT